MNDEAKKPIVITVRGERRRPSSSTWSTIAKACALVAVGGGLAYLAASSGVALRVGPSSAPTCPHCGGAKDAGSSWCRFCGQRYDADAWLERVDAAAASSGR